MGGRGRGRGPHGRSGRGVVGHRYAVRPQRSIIVADDDALASPADDELESSRGPNRFLEQYQRRRRAWLGHLRSFIGVNTGLAAINILTAIASHNSFPWFLFATAGWGMGLIIHGLGYRGWVKDNADTLRRAQFEARQVGGEADSLESGSSPTLPADDSPKALPSADDGWDRLIEDCRAAASSARAALDEAELDAADRVVLELENTLDRGLGTIETIRQSARAVKAALDEVAPHGIAALDGELVALESKIDATSDERLRRVYEVNRQLLQARRDKVSTLEAEGERMEATVKGFLLTAQNVRLDAAKLGAGGIPDLLGSLQDSLQRLDDEVEVARQVEDELEKLSLE